MRDSERRLTLRVTGGSALFLAAAAILTCVLNAAWTRDTLPEGGLEAIRRALANEYRLRRIAAASLPEGATEELAEDLKRLSTVSVPSFRTKGWGFSRIARIEVAVSGEPPPDGRTVRYLQLRCGPLTPCFVVAEVSRLKYWLGLWFVEPAVPGFPAVE